MPDFVDFVVSAPALKRETLCKYVHLLLKAYYKDQIHNHFACSRPRLCNIWCIVCVCRPHSLTPFQVQIVQIKHLKEKEYFLNPGLVDTVHLTWCHPLVQTKCCILAKPYQLTFFPLLSILTKAESLPGQHQEVRSPVSCHAAQQEHPTPVSLAPPYAPVSVMSKTGPEVPTAPAPTQSPAAPTRSSAAPSQSSAAQSQSPAAPPSPAPAPKTPSQSVFEETKPKASGEFPFKRSERGEYHRDTRTPLSLLQYLSSFPFLTLCFPISLSDLQFYVSFFPFLLLQ